jgi:hypothetical protein
VKYLILKHQKLILFCCYKYLLAIDFENEYEHKIFDRISELVKSINTINEEIENETDSRKKELNLRIKENIISKINTQIDELIELKVEENNEC